MAFYTGRSGSLAFGTTTNSGPTESLTAPTTKPVAKIRDWSIDVTMETISTNSIDSAYNTFVPSVKGATGSATLIYYRLESGEDASKSGFNELLNKTPLSKGAMEVTDRVYLELNAGGGSNDDIKFWAYITSVGTSVSAGELSTVNIQFAMDGDFLEVIV